MNGFGGWLFNFMRGRYGFDEYGRHLGIVTIVLIIVSIVAGVISQLVFDITRLYALGSVLGLASVFVNWASIAVLIWLFFRVLSRNIEKRRAENERYLARRSKRGQKRSRKDRPGAQGRARSRKGAAGHAEQDIFQGAQGYAYLTCPFCGQRMRVPRGRGKIAVKCPSCGEKTIVNS